MSTVNATFVWFNAFLQELGRGTHDLENDTIQAYLSNDAPVVATDATSADVVEISTGNGYTGPQDISGAFSQTAGVATFSSAAAFTITATGAIGPFRYLVFRNNSKSNKLIGYVPWPQAISLAATEVFTGPAASQFTIP